MLKVNIMFYQWKHCQHIRKHTKNKNFFAFIFQRKEYEEDNDTIKGADTLESIVARHDTFSDFNFEQSYPATSNSSPQPLCLKHLGG